MSCFPSPLGLGLHSDALRCGAGLDPLPVVVTGPTPVLTPLASDWETTPLLCLCPFDQCDQTNMKEIQVFMVKRDESIDVQIITVSL